jgi:hypothetical protein
MVNIDVHYDAANLYQIAVYQRCQSAFLKHGINLNFCPNCPPDANSRADMFLVQPEFIGPDPQKLRRPIVVEERQDSSMPIAREVIVVPNVVRFFKVGVVRPEFINAKAERVHLWLLDRGTAEATCPTRRALSEQESAKVQPGITFALFPSLEPWATRAFERKRINKWEHRPIDVLFIGSTRYGLPTLTAHRERFCQVLQEIRGLNIVCVPSRAMNGSHYMEISHHAKIVVSPWGYGELCYRDFEAMLDGCVLLKPRTDFVRTLDDMLQEESSYVPCERDASDLESKVRLVLESEVYRDEERRQTIRAKILQWWKEDKLPLWWCDEIECALRG